MSKRSKIRWRESDEKELARVVRNYNAKLSRVIKNTTDQNVVLPERAYVKEIKSKVETRADLNRMMNSLKRFSEKGSEEIVESDYGLKITRYQKNEASISVGIINRRRAIKRKELENIEVTTRGKPTGTTRPEMGSVVMNSLQPKRFEFKNKKPAEWASFVRSINNMVRTGYQDEADTRLIQNYIKGLQDVFSGFDDLDELIEAVKNNPNFIKYFYTETEAHINFIYDPQELRRKYNIIKEIWINDNISNNPPKRKRKRK